MEGSRGRFRTRGHPLALAGVQRAVARGRAPHSVLMIGPAGVGKTTLALDLAAGLLCTADDPLDRPCRACAACRKVDHGNHPDLHRIATEGAGEQIRLAQVQALVSELALLPMEARLRVAVDRVRAPPQSGRPERACSRRSRNPWAKPASCCVPTTRRPSCPPSRAVPRVSASGPVPSDAIADLLQERGARGRRTCRHPRPRRGRIPRPRARPRPKPRRGAGPGAHRAPARGPAHRRPAHPARGERQPDG